MSIRRCSAFLLAAAIALPGAAVASHMMNYRTNPVLHDDLGRSHEPDFAATGVLGWPLLNCVVDAPPFASPNAGLCGDDPFPTGLYVDHPTYPGDEIAPGCTRDGPERAPSGLCGLRTIGPAGTGPGPPPLLPPLGEPGMSGAVAPGAFTPTKATQVAFLDGKLTPTVAFNRWVPVGEPLGDAGLPGLRGVLPHSYIPWAWFGTWRDLNGNGVIDHLTPGTAGPTQNEFTFRGGCVDFNGAWNPPIFPGGQTAIGLGLCQEEVNGNAPGAAPCLGAPPNASCGAKTSIDLWLYPGNHHGGELVGCLVAAAPCLPLDYPGNQVVVWTLNGFDCGGPPSCDETAARQTFEGTSGGDPLLDHPGEVVPDDTLHDRTADTDPNRMWVGFGGNNGPVYDESLLTNLVAVFGVNCAEAPWVPQARDLASCTFVDVDLHDALSPAAHALLTATVKPALRSTWVMVRDTAPSLLGLVESHVHGRALYEATLGPEQGHANDLLLNPGWSREPNHPGDAFPGVAFAACPGSAWPSPGEAQHRGTCNVPAFDALSGSTPAIAYGLHEGAFRGWLDQQVQGNVLYYRSISLLTGPCTLCGTGASLNHGLSPPPLSSPDGADAHARTLPPGQYYIQAIGGLWMDAPHTLLEPGFPGPPVPETYPADGWVGFLAESTGQLRYRGYADVGPGPDPLAACTTEKGSGQGRPRAECNPYLDGNIQDPADYRLYAPASSPPSDGEWLGACPVPSAVATLTPAGGVWSADVLVWRNHWKGIGPLLGPGGSLNPDWPFGPGSGIEVVPAGSSQPIVVGMHCAFGYLGAMESSDYLIWPEGARGDVLVSMSAAIPLPGGGVDVVTDADLYKAWV